MLNEADVKKVAHLARLSLTDEETQALAKQLSSVLKHFEQVAKVNTDGVEPLITPSEIEMFWRDDKSEAWGSVEAAISNAPATVGNLFKVPPVVG